MPAAKTTGETVYAGTVVTRGRGDVVVGATAEATAIGGIARSLRGGDHAGTPLQRQLAVLGGGSHSRSAWRPSCSAR